MGMTNTSSTVMSYPGKGQTATLPTGGSGNSGPLAPGKVRKPKSRDALIRRYVRSRLGVTDIRKATPDQIKALRAKNLLPSGPAKKQSPSRVAAMGAVRSSRTGGGSD